MRESNRMGAEATLTRLTLKDRGVVSGIGGVVEVTKVWRGELWKETRRCLKFQRTSH